MSKRGTRKRKIALVRRHLKRFLGTRVPFAWRYRVFSLLAALRRYQRHHVTFIAVTGSCGKSTTIALAAAILSTAGKCTIGVGPRRTLVPDTIIGVKPSTRFCIQELHATVRGMVAKFLRLLKPQIGVVTTIGSDHYREYRSLEAIAREKGLLVERLPPSGVAILNIDDPLVHGMAKRGRARVMTFGRSPQADVRAVEVSGVGPIDSRCKSLTGMRSSRSRQSLLASFGCLRCWQQLLWALPVGLISKHVPRP